MRISTRGAFLAALVGLLFAATGGCGAILGLEPPFADTSDDGDARGGDEAASQADVSVEDGPRDAATDGDGKRRVECLHGNLVHLASSEPLGPPPSFGSNAGYLFGIVVDQRSADDVTAYVAVSDDYNGGAGRIYRVINGGPT